jgi:hypothetical protein
MYWMQQLFIVGTLGSLFIFVPLHARLSHHELASNLESQRHPVALDPTRDEGQMVVWLNPAWVGQGQHKGESTIR